MEVLGGKEEVMEALCCFYGHQVVLCLSGFLKGMTHEHSENQMT